MAGQGSSEGRRGTRVTFLDQTGAKSVDAVIADTVTVKRILPNIITKMNLPVKPIWLLDGSSSLETSSAASNEAAGG